jgi:hypothetical protein
MHVTSYTYLLVAKMLSVLAFAGGTGAALLAADRDTRRRAVHRVASPALVCTWVVGYLLAGRIATPLSELWPLAGFVLSLLALLILIHMTSRDRAGALSATAALVCIAAVIFVMIVRPTWSSL